MAKFATIPNIKGTIHLPILGWWSVHNIMETKLNILKNGKIKKGKSKKKPTHILMRLVILILSSIF